MISKKKPQLLIALGAIALIAGGASAYWLLARRLPLAEMPVGADVLPQDALIMLSVSTDEGQWRRLREFGTPETQKTLDSTLVDWRDRLLTANGLNYKQDIQPWVGDKVTVAFLPPKTDVPEENSDGQPPILQPGDDQQTPVFVLPIADPVQAKQSLEDTPQGEVTERDYKGLKVQEFKGSGEQTYSSLVVDNRLLVVSPEGTAIERVIDTIKGESSMAQTPGYNQALRQIAAPQPFLWIYVNAPEARAITSPSPTQALPPQNLTPLRNNRGIGATVTLEPDGMRLQGVAWLDPESDQTYTAKNNARQMPTLLPAQTLMMASGGNLQQLWQDYSQQSDLSPTGPLNPDNLRTGLQTFTGLDLDADLMTWMGGEFALALVQTPSQSEGSQSPSAAGAGVLFMVQASDRRAADTALAQLDEVMRDRFRFQVGDVTVNGESVKQWTSPFAALTVTRGWLHGDVAFIAFGNGIANTIVPEPQEPLSDNKRFEESTSSQLTPNNGHFFIDVENLLKPDSRVPLPDLPPDSQAFVSAIRSIGVTAAIRDERSTRYDIHVMLEKAGNPGPLPSPEASPNADSSPSPSPEPSP